MKKLLIFFTLFLIFGGVAYSKSDIDIAIEKCADIQIVLGNKKNIPKSFYEEHLIYKSMLEKKQLLKRDYDAYGDIYKATYTKYWKDNPKPPGVKYETQSTYNFEDYKKAKAEWDKKEKEYLKPYEEKILLKGGEVKKQDALVKEMMRSLVATKLKKMNLKNKSKTIQGYTSQFMLCEGAHNKTPKGFMLEWSK